MQTHKTKQNTFIEIIILLPHIIICTFIATHSRGLKGTAVLLVLIPQVNDSVPQSNTFLLTFVEELVDLFLIRTSIREIVISYALLWRGLELFFLYMKLEVRSCVDAYISVGMS